MLDPGAEFSKNLLVIGSEGGLGKAVVALWQSKGFTVWGIDQVKLTRSSVDHYVQFNLVDDFSLLMPILEKAQFDQVIFCAATGFYGEFVKEDNILEHVQVNLVAPIKFTKKVLPLIKPLGQLIFIGSVASHMPTPDYITYSATKRGLESFVRSLRLELKGRFKIKIFHPGAIATEFHSKVGFQVSLSQARSFKTPEQVASRLWRFSLAPQWLGGGFWLRFIDHWMASVFDMFFRIGRFKS